MYNIHSSGWILFKFATDEDRQKVLNGGPYSQSGRQLHLKPISKYFSFDAKEMSIVPVWVKYHNWPLEFWNKNALSKFSAQIGSPECTDALTCLKKSVSYARVLLHIDATKELKKEITTRLPSGELRKIEIEYEHIPKYCTHCSTLTHNTKDCFKLKNPKEKKAEVEKIEKNPQPATQTP